MNYINGLNKEIRNYFMILCNNDYPKFINKYINTKTMQRLKYIGFFCGMDYQNIDMIKPKYWYSRLDHSIACALMTWNFTHAKVQTLAALFHDLGTPSFSHCIDFLLEDHINQNSSEKSVKEVINASNEIKLLLYKDNININDVDDVNNYDLLENEKPKLCIDRLDGILTTGLIWNKFWNLKDIKIIYKSVIICINEENKHELGFKGLKHCEKFYQGAYKYSMLLQSNEDKLLMQYLSDILKFAIEYKIINFNDLYILKEEEIIKRIANSNIKDMWIKYINITSIKRSSKKILNKYCISVSSKKRYVNPLCLYKNEIKRITEISLIAKSLLDRYLVYNDSPYAYID